MLTIIYHLPKKLWEGNVFSPNVGSLCGHYPLCIGSHHTGTSFWFQPQAPWIWNLTVQGPPRAWKLTVQGPPILFLPLDMRPHCRWTPFTASLASDIWWPILETCSNLFTGDPPDPCLHLVATKTRLASRLYTSYWNVFV